MEEIILKELNRQIALRCKEKIDRLMGVCSYLSSVDVDGMIENILKYLSEEFNKDEMFKSIKNTLYIHLEAEYEIVNFDDREFVVNKDKMSKEIFEELEGNK